jgi:kynurenine formamidase
MILGASPPVTRGVAGREAGMAKRWKRRPEGSTWGDWGEDDQRGRLNLLTPERLKRAVAEVKEGLSFCLSLPLNLPGGNAVNPKRHPPTFQPVFIEGDVYFNYVWDKYVPGNMDVTCDEAIMLYSQYSTQWDSLAHVGSLFDADDDGKLEVVYYNGFRAGRHIGSEPGDGMLGARALGIENMAETGVQGRGVLIDLHRHFGARRVAIGYDTLMQVMEKDGVTVEEGDVLALHTGWDDMILAMNGKPDAAKLHASGAVLDGFDDKLLQWITDCGVVAIVSDNMGVEDSSGSGDTQGGHSRLPLHRHCLFRLGVHLGELWYLSALAKALRQRGRCRFLLTAPPLRMPGAVGSPVTPVGAI